MTTEYAQPSGVDAVEAANVLNAIQEALHRDYSPSFLGTLQRRYDNLTGLDPFSYGVDEKKARAAEQNNAIAAAVAIQDHERFASQGFNNRQDLFAFGRNLGNDDYWNWLNENPDEKKKVADKFTDGLIEEARKRDVPVGAIIDEVKKNSPYPDRVKDLISSDRLSQYGVNKSNPVEKLRKTTENMAGRERVEVLVADNIARAASVARGDKVATEEATNDSRESSKEVRDAVIAKADEVGIDSKYAKGNGEFASAWLETEEFQTAKNTLQENQKQIADANKPASSPTEIQIAQNDTGKSGGLST